MSTGFIELDRIIGGIDLKEENMVIAARTGQGKTWTLLKIAAEAAKQGLTVGLYSGEMSERKVGYRIDTMRSHISNWKLTHGIVDVQPEYEKYINLLNAWHPLLNKNQAVKKYIKAINYFCNILNISLTCISDIIAQYIDKVYSKKIDKEEILDMIIKHK